MAPNSETTTMAASDNGSLSNEFKDPEKASVPEVAEKADLASLHSHRTKEAKYTAEQEMAALDNMEEEPEYPSGWKLTIITIALALSVFLIALDNTIIATAIPRITDHFNKLNDVGWYGSAYLLTTCSFQLMFGKFYTFFPIKHVYLIAIAIFEIGSAVCGAAPTSTALIIGRAVAGLGTGGVFSGALIIIAHSVPLAKRPMYTGLVTAAYGVASIAGPLLGGVFTDKLTWRWCFYINLPIGAVTILGILVFFTNPHQKAQTKTRMEKFRSFDPYGTVVFLPAIICLLLALQWGGSTYAWGNGRIIALLVIFGVLISIFIVIQIWQGENATLPPRIISQRSMAFGVFYAMCLGGSFFLFTYYIPIWFQAIKGASAVRSGIMTIPLVLSVVVASMICGGVVTKIGYYSPFFLTGTILTSVGAGLITTFETNTGHSKWIGYLVLYGIGIGSGFQQPLMLAQTVNKLEDIPMGTASVMFFQTLGGALFVSVAQNVFDNRLVSSLEKISPSLASTILEVGATKLKENVPASLLHAVRLAYNNALDDTYYVALALSCLTLIGTLGIEWNRSVKGVKVEMVAA